MIFDDQRLVPFFMTCTSVYKRGVPPRDTTKTDAPAAHMTEIEPASFADQFEQHNVTMEEQPHKPLSFELQLTKPIVLKISATDYAGKTSNLPLEYFPEIPLSKKIMAADLAILEFNCLVISCNKKWGYYFLDRKPDTAIYYPMEVHPAALPEDETAPSVMKDFFVEYQPPLTQAEVMRQGGIWRKTVMTENRAFQRFMAAFGRMFPNIKDKGNGTIKIWFNKKIGEDNYNEDMRWLLFQMAIMVFPRLIWHDFRTEQDYIWKHKKDPNEKVVKGWSLFHSPYL